MALIGLIIVVLVGLLFLLSLVFGSFFIVPQQSAVIIERFGKFSRVCKAGFHFKFPFIESRVTEISLRVSEEDIPVETKTKDDVTIGVQATVQFKVTDAYKAFYELDDPVKQMKSYILDVVRRVVPEMTLDEVFTNKAKIADEVTADLSQIMDDYGYVIVAVLITDINIEKRVLAAMNKIQEAARLRTAATDEAEAERIRVITAAKADAERAQLQGEGIANQRMAIANGLAQSIAQIQSQDLTSREAMMQLLMVQYFDALESMAQANGNATIIMLPGGIESLEQVQTQILALLAQDKPK